MTPERKRKLEAFFDAVMKPGTTTHALLTLDSVPEDILVIKRAELDRLKAETGCPIGVTVPAVCSAGTCHACLIDRTKYLQAQVEELTRDRDEALQLDGGCSTLKEMATASFVARVRVEELTRALTDARSILRANNLGHVHEALAMIDSALTMGPPHG